MPFILALLFIVVPILEIAVLIQVGQVIGVGPTILLLIGMSIAGGVLAKREGLAVWTRFRAAVGRGEIPSKEIVDGVLVLFGAALLLTPGFLTDILGMVLLIPVSRAAVRRSVMKGGSWLVARRFPILIPLGFVRGRARRVKARTVNVEPGPGAEDRWSDTEDIKRIPGR
ncbi:MAG TPA: FxsA family protein [Actinomycetota bacterium]|nr:FxsA family protein [Actinomycetota bacterium]